MCLSCLFQRKDVSVPPPGTPVEKGDVNELLPLHGIIDDVTGQHAGGTIRSDGCHQRRRVNGLRSISLREDEIATEQTVSTAGMGFQTTAHGV